MHNLPTRRTPPVRGFTLIEILVVLLVVAILATLVAPNVLQHVGEAKSVAARSQIEMLGGALDVYRLHNGRYPTSEEGLRSLWERPSGEAAPNWRGPYLRRPVPADPWSVPYVYRSPGTANPAGYDLSSLGADRAPGGAGESADLTSWQ